MGAEGIGYRLSPLIVLAAVLVLGLTLRVIGLAENPPGMFVDETSLAVNARLVAAAGIDQYGVRWPLFFRALDDYKEPLFVYSVALAVAVSDASLFALRLPAALWGSLGLLVAYLLGREVEGSDEGGFWTALFLAVTPWHVQFSRWSEQAVVLATVHSAAVLFLLRALRRGAVRDGILGGVLLAAELYAYSPARLLVPMTAFAFLCMALARGAWRSASVRAVLASLVLAAVPFAVAYAAADGGMSLRFEALRLPISDVPKAYLAHLSPGFLFGRGDANLRHTPGWSLLPLYLAPLWLVGAARAVRRRSRTGLAMIALTLIAPLLGSLTQEFPHASRTIPMLPFIQVTAAGGVIAILGWLPGRVVLIVRLLLLLLASGSLVRFWEHYWLQYPRQSAVAWRAGLVPSLEFARRSALPGERILAPTAWYCDWLYVAPPDPRVLAARRQALATGRQALDPVDAAGKFRFLTDPVALEPGGQDGRGHYVFGPGLWVLPASDVAPPLPACLFRSGLYCVIRLDSQEAPRRVAEASP